MCSLTLGAYYSLIPDKMYCLDSHLHGSGIVVFSCSPDSQFVVSVGQSRVIHITELLKSMERSTVEGDDPGS